MKLSEVLNIVKDCSYPVPFYVKTTDGKRKRIRFFSRNGIVYTMGKRDRKYGYGLYSSHCENWVSLTKAGSAKTDTFKRYLKRANAALAMLEESGLWNDIREEVKHFLSLSEEEQRQMVKDIETDCYNLFYLQTFNGGKYVWARFYQIFESFAAKNCWKSIAWSKWERERMSAEVAECIKNGTEYYHRWIHGYDNTVEVANRNGEKKAWYSEEYRNCGNGWYYLMFDATHAIFFEKD